MPQSVVKGSLVARKVTRKLGVTASHTFCSALYQHPQWWTRQLLSMAFFRFRVTTYCPTRCQGVCVWQLTADTVPGAFIYEHWGHEDGLMMMWGDTNVLARITVQFIQDIPTLQDMGSDSILLDDRAIPYCARTGVDFLRQRQVPWIDGPSPSSLVSCT